ncbi:hypothetical protein EDB82DRAFT_196878 [Fusarium venenatum]|uniref:uncharacterized protein n=1 Tax=Fusarium venenatum TaxID=56646 RepID=UPI001D706758|nr:hypothetical protein EDB82DRAFT_196878 [Fusarium venenatum]
MGLTRDDVVSFFIRSVHGANLSALFLFLVVAKSLISSRAVWSGEMERCKIRVRSNGRCFMAAQERRLSRASHSETLRVFLPTLVLLCFIAINKMHTYT